MIEFKYFLHGGLPDGLTLENIKQGMVAKRNKITVEILDKLDAIENYASGVRRIFKDYIGFDKQPEYSISDNGIIVTLYNMNYNEAQNEVINDGINEDINDVINVGQKLNTEERKNIILKLIEENEKISIQQIVENIEVSKSTVERDLKELKEQNKIKYIGSRKSGKWIINYEQENVGINEEINVGIKRENVGINDSEKMNTELRQNSILKIIKENGNISAIEISKILNFTARTIERDLKELKEQNKIEYVGSRKSGKWIINYEQENVGINEEINVGIKRENVGINDSEKMNTELRQNSILKIIKENGNISAIEISKILNFTARTIERDLKELKEQNKIEYVGSRKSGKWIIKE